MIKLDIQGITSIVTESHRGYIFNFLFDKVLSIISTEELDTRKQIIWIDKSGTAPFEILESKVLKYLQGSENGSKISQQQILERVKYAQCFDLEGIFQVLQESNIENIRLIVILEIYDLFTDMKLQDRTKALAVFNEIMLWLRKRLSVDGLLDVCLFDTEATGGTNETFLIDYYVYKKYRVSSLGITCM